MALKGQKSPPLHSWGKILKLLSISLEKYLQINNKFITIIDIIIITFKKEIMKSVTFTTFSYYWNYFFTH